MRTLKSWPAWIETTTRATPHWLKPLEVAFFVPEANELDLTIARVLMWQLITGVGLAAVTWGVFGVVAGYSTLLGSLACVVPNAFLAMRLVVPRQDPGAKALLRAAWLGEIGKLALTILIFSLVFVLVRPLSAAALFAGFIATQLVTFAGFLMRSASDTETDNTNGS